MSEYVSVRMRASREGVHLSGGERLIPVAHAGPAARSLLARGLCAGSGQAERIVLTIDPVERDRIVEVPALHVRTLDVGDASEGRARAAELLRNVGVADVSIEAAMHWLSTGANPAGGNMRGAILMDARTSERMEPDRARGVRVSFVDFSPEVRARFVARFRDRAATSRFRDALVLASKVAACDGVIAEICWSDDPEYEPGYVASTTFGYVRFTKLKRRGDPLGGRVYFVDARRFDRSRGIVFLESQPVLITIANVSIFAEA